MDTNKINLGVSSGTVSDISASKHLSNFGRRRTMPRGATLKQVIAWIQDDHDFPAEIEKSLIKSASKFPSGSIGVFIKNFEGYVTRAKKEE